jgi:formate--tetrahydrofolate ligase
VIVATVRALKYHGGADLKVLDQENNNYLLNGINNLKKHINNLHEVFGMQVIVAINHFVQDTQAEIDGLKKAVEALGSKAIVCKHWANGGAGATDLASEVVSVLAQNKSKFKLLYQDKLSLREKLATIATKIYGAAGVEFSDKAAEKLAVLEKQYAHFPICVAKTQYSFSSDPALRGAPVGHTLTVNELRLSRGAGFIVAICGKIMTMPGLPKIPASQRIDVSAAGSISGLS